MWRRCSFNDLPCTRVLGEKLWGCSMYTPVTRILTRAIVVPATAFHAVLNTRSETFSEYAGMPLADLSLSKRGEVLAVLVRNVIADIYPDAQIVSASRGYCQDARRRGWNMTEYDWLWNGRRIECKSAQFCWNTSQHHWGFCFQGIKLPHVGAPRALPLFDDLLLALYTPHAVHIYLHNLELGLSASGRRTADIGHQLKLTGPSKERSLSIALSGVLRKLDSASNNCKRIAAVPLADERMSAALAACRPHSKASIYKDIPLADMNGSARGLCLQAIARTVDAMIHPDAIIEDAGGGGLRVNGARRGHNQAHYDWTRNGQRIECKSSQLSWDRYWMRWYCTFHNIKFGQNGSHNDTMFDELQLVFHTPRGIYVYRHDLKLGIARRGKATAVLGSVVQLYGPARQEHWSVALDVILCKLNNSDCSRIAYIPWR